VLNGVLAQMVTTGELGVCQTTLPCQGLDLCTEPTQGGIGLKRKEWLLVHHTLIICVLAVPDAALGSYLL
jgi:hypothetical protein